MTASILSDVDQILRRRAEALSIREDREHHADTEAIALVTVSRHRLGVPLSHVKRGVKLSHLTEIPSAPPYLIGVTAIDGHPVSVLHLPNFLGLGRRGLSDITACLVVSVGVREIGLAAEQLLGIEDFTADRIVPTPRGSEPLTRIVRQSGEEEDLPLLDVKALFEDPRLGRA
jgi:chemotaxis signal transduction protein